MCIQSITVSAKNAKIKQAVSLFKAEKKRNRINYKRDDEIRHDESCTNRKRM